MSVEVYDVDHGLSNESISDILTDKYGYKWFATGHGLNRYDGISFESFRSDPRDTTAIWANSLGQLFEDRDANIWVSFDIGGISKYDRVTEEFRFYNYDPKVGSDLNNFVVDALFDKKGRGWVGTETAINLINYKTQRFEKIPLGDLDSVRVRNIYESKLGTIWIGTSHGLFKFNESTQVFDEVKDEAGESIVYILRFLEDRDGMFWVASNDRALYRLDSEDAIPEKIELPGDSESWISNLVETKKSNPILSLARRGLFEWRNGHWEELPLSDLPSDKFFYSYSCEKNDKIFVYSFDQQAYLYHYPTRTINQVPGFSKGILTLNLDPDDQNLWLGTRNFGLYHIVEKSPLFQTIVATEHPRPNQNYANFIINLEETSDGETYFVAGSGLFHRDKSTGEIEHVIDYWRAGDFNFGINAIEELDSEHLLMGTQIGLFKFHRKTRKVTRFHSLEERISDFQIRGDKLWAIGNFGLFVYDLSERGTKIFREIIDAPSSLQTNMTRKIYVDKEGIAWIGTVRDGLYRVEQVEDELVFDQYLYSGARTSEFLSQSINAIFEDRSGKLWIGGFSTGLLEFDRDRREFINYTPEGELPIPNVQAIEQADDGCLWLSASDGIHKFVPDQNAFKKYTTSDGMATNSHVLRSSTKTIDGKILFGSNKGITMFDPSKTDVEGKMPKVHIENITSLNRQLKLEQPIQDTKNIDLRYNQNSISIDFIALDFNDANRITYAYKLGELTDQWVNLESSRSVSLTNLRPGTYEFQVKATLNKGVWSEPASLFIHVNAPFWLKPWFFGLMAVMMLGILWSVYRIRLTQKLKRIRFFEQVRQKAAADFHDEMGNKLTRIALFTDVLKQKLNGTTPEITEYVDKIRDNSRSLNSSMRDFLWALDPKKDTAHDLAVMLKDFGEELFDKTDVEFHIECIESGLQRYKLDMDWKRNLIMIFKEAMHNVLKHAKAKKVSLAFDLIEDKIRILLTDDGKGLDHGKSVEGYGIRNMNYRTAELGGDLEIKETESGGTSIQFMGDLKEFSIA